MNAHDLPDRSDPSDPADRASRPATDVLHRQIVERAVHTIQSRFREEDLRLSVLADASFSSPFHLARLFRRIAGVPPGHFLTAVRMQAAKHLLVRTRLSVIDVCLEVGYSSVGTFTRRFRELVGVSPRRYRRAAAGQSSPAAPSTLADPLAAEPAASVSSLSTVEGTVDGPDASGPIFVGLFASAVPQGRPVACALLTRYGTYRITQVPEGRYLALAVALDVDADPACEPDLRGAAAAPVTVGCDTHTRRVDIRLRHRLVTDPPIVIALPLLIAEAHARDVLSGAAEAPPHPARTPDRRGPSPRAV